MADGLVVATGVSGSGILHSLVVKGDANVLANVLGRVVSQGFTGALTTVGTANLTLTGVSGSAAVANVIATPVWTALATNGVRATAGTGQVEARGSNFKNYLHPYVKNQIPEYIRESYPLFVQFVEGYYRFLDSPGQANDLLLNSAEWTDIDKTLDMFVDRLRAQFALDFPHTAIVDGRRFVKQVHEFYESKGTERSIAMFFKMIYNDEVKVDYPSKLILRASDGRWKRDVSIKLNTYGYSGNKLFVYFDDNYTEGQGADYGYAYQIGNNTNPFDLIGKQVTVEFWRTIPGSGLVREKIHTNVIDVKKTLNPVIYDLIVDLDPLTEILDQAVVVFSGLEYGMLTRQYLTYEVIDPGEGFVPGDVLYVNEEGQGGDYFLGDYLINLDQSSSSAYVASNPLNNGILRVSTIDEDTGVALASIINTGYLFINPEFTITLFGANATAGADIKFTTGFIYQHQGLFTDSSGLLSDACVLQDNNYYQAYSYVITTKIDPEIWKESYLKAVHPAGIKMFSNFVTSDIANFRQTIDATDDTRETLRTIVNNFEVTDVLFWHLNYTMPIDIFSMVDNGITWNLNKVMTTDTATMVDAGTAFDVGKVLADATTGATDVFDRVVDYNRDFVETPTTSEVLAKDFGKLLSDIATPTEVLTMDVAKSLSDTATTGDASITFVQEKALSDIADLNDSAPVFDVGKALSDLATAGDASFSKSIAPSFSDATSGATDSLAKSVSTVLSDSVTATDDGGIVSTLVPFANEAATTSDAINSFNVGKSASDSVASSDVMVRDMSKELSDATSGATDAATFDVDKALSDSATAGESMAFVWDYGRLFNDTATAAEVMVCDVTWSRNFIETPTATDVFASVITWDRQFADSVGKSDSISINTSTAPADTATADDAGNGYVQDYMDTQSYTDPGYTGLIFSFT